MGATVLATAATSARPPSPRTAARLAPAAPLELTLTGSLMCDAEMRLTPGNNLPTVTVLIAQAGGPPLRAVELFSEGPASCQVAASKARSLRAGARVELRCEGLRARRVPAHGEVLQIAIVHRLRLLEPAFDAAMAAANDHSLDGDEQ